MNLRSQENGLPAPSSALLTAEDLSIRMRMPFPISRAYRVADERDYMAMQACREDRDCVDMEEHGLSDNVATRIHHGVLAFRAGI